MKKTDNQPGAFNSSNQVVIYPIQQELGRKPGLSVKDKVVFGRFGPLRAHGLNFLKFSGADLASVHSAKQNSWMFSHLNGMQYWLGANDIKALRAI